MRHLTQEQLSEKSNISARHIANIEKGRMNPSFEVLHALVTCLGISADSLFYPEKTSNNDALSSICTQLLVLSEKECRLLMDTMQFMANNMSNDHEL